MNLLLSLTFVSIIILKILNYVSLDDMLNVV